MGAGTDFGGLEGGWELGWRIWWVEVRFGAYLGKLEPLERNLR